VRLTELEPELVAHAPSASAAHLPLTLDNAQGLLFVCPKCHSAQGRPGSHSVLCWFRNRGVPDDETPGPGRWDVSGTGFDDLSLSPSVHLSGPGCGWHGFIRNGEIITC